MKCIKLSAYRSVCQGGQYQNNHKEFPKKDLNLHFLIIFLLFANNIITIRKSRKINACVTNKKNDEMNFEN